MTITVYGGGAIGGLTAAYLAQSGKDVLLVDRKRNNVDKINDQGMKITGTANFVQPISACMPEDLHGPLDLVLLAVKSQDTISALDVIEPLAGSRTVIVSLQNGMNPPLIASRLGPERTVASFINYSADWQEPGHVEHGGNGAFYIGETDESLSERLYELQNLLSVVVPVCVTDNIYGYLWAKQIELSILFAQAVTDLSMPEILGGRLYQPLLIALIGEGAGVAQAAGIRLESFDLFEPKKMRPRDETKAQLAFAVLDRMAARYRKRVKQRSGPWRDLAIRKRKTDVDYMIGWVIAEGKKLEIDLPLNDCLFDQVKEIEAGVRNLGLDNFEELESLRKKIYGPHIGPH
jgi:2-dehydropantoate 2-reductase